MTTTTANQIEEQILGHLQEEVGCELLSEQDGRIGCLTALDYPNGDGVVVWVRQLDGKFEITDYGEALADFAAYEGKEREPVVDFARMVCRGHGIDFISGRLTVRCDWDRLGEFVWALGSAAAQISQAAGVMRPRRRQREPESEFVGEVERTLRERELPVRREHRLEGRSGHRHRATIWIPATHSVLEPVTGHWNQVTATYAKLGDLMQANGFRLYSLLDDRQGPPDEDVSGLLVQVSRVVQWSRREEWVESLALGSSELPE
jgi:hypothetical protein